MSWTPISHNASHTYFSQLSGPEAKKPNQKVTLHSILSIIARERHQNSLFPRQYADVLLIRKRASRMLRIHRQGMVFVFLRRWRSAILHGTRSFSKAVHSPASARALHTSVVFLGVWWQTCPTLTRTADIDSHRTFPIPIEWYFKRKKYSNRAWKTKHILKVPLAFQPTSLFFDNNLLRRGFSFSTSSWWLELYSI